VDEVFRALADPSRRRLLDKLFKRDGQTLGELEAHLPDMTRFGVMKHLGVLEEAGLIATRKVGREKLHYLNPVPIRRVFDRWTSKYAKPFTRALSDLKEQLEGDVHVERGPTLVHEVYIRTTPEQLWDAITEPERTQQYFFGTSVKSDWRVGSPVVRTAGGRVVHEGEVLEIERPRRLVMTFAHKTRPELRDDRPSRVAWTIEPLGAVCKLTIVHDDFDGETATYNLVGPSWSLVLSGLKTLLETGEALPALPPKAT
jgi:uncharacterized protein YndB with AHSA1/START domain